MLFGLSRNACGRLGQGGNLPTDEASQNSKTEGGTIMKTYYVRTFDREDEKGCVCGYAYAQFLEIVRMLEEAGVEFTTWVE